MRSRRGSGDASATTHRSCSSAGLVVIRATLRRALTFTMAPPPGGSGVRDPLRCRRSIDTVTAVNDPTSAVEGLDALEAILIALGHRPLRAHDRRRRWAVRLLLPSQDSFELIDLALTEIRWYGADAPQVARRMTALL